MKITSSQTVRLEFLARVTNKDCQHLQDTDSRLFGDLFTIEEARRLLPTQADTSIPQN